MEYLELHYSTRYCDIESAKGICSCACLLESSSDVLMRINGTLARVAMGLVCVVALAMALAMVLSVVVVSVVGIVASLES